MDARQTAALSHVDLAGQGLEIGPSYSPLVPKSFQPSVETVDHATRDELVAKYTSYGLGQDLIDRIDEVDYVWAGGQLVDTIGAKEHYDYIVAAHVIEHQVDLIAFLQDCDALLKPGGRLALVVPDKRASFDLFKPLSTVGDVVDAHLRPTTFHTAGGFVDHVAYACLLDGQIAWGLGQQGKLETQFADLSSVSVEIQQALDQDMYRDIHRWIFTPASFSLLIEDLAELGYHNFDEVGSAPTSGYEFYVTLTKTDEPAPKAPRIERLLKIRDEVGGDQSQEGLVEKVARLERQLAEARQRNHELKTSTSWRLTRPLRRATTWARDFKNR